MNPCPQCGASLGEGASGCASCGWKASKKTLWIVLASILGVLILGCCGIGAWFVHLSRGMLTHMQDKGTPTLLALYRLQVVRYGVRHGELPKELILATSVPVETEGGEPLELPLPPSPDGRPSDSWMRGVRYTPGEAGAFELRSAGPDGTFDNVDDITLSGSTSDDQDAVFAEFRARAEEVARAMVEVFPEFMRKDGVKTQVNFGKPIPAVREEPKDEGAKPVEGEGGSSAPDKVEDTGSGKDGDVEGDE